MGQFADVKTLHNYGPFLSVLFLFISGDSPEKFGKKRNRRQRCQDVEGLGVELSRAPPSIAAKAAENFLCAVREDDHS